MSNYPAGRAARTSRVCARLLSSASLAALILAPLPALAVGSDGVWGGGGSTTTTTDFNTGTNWDIGAVPSNSATFSGAGNSTVNLSAPVTINTVNISSSYTFTGSAISLGSNLSDNGSGATISIANNITAGVINMSDATGTLTFSGTNSYSGATTISAGGKLLAGSTGAFSANSNYNVAGTLDLNGFSNTVNSLFGSTGTVTNGSGTAATLTIGGPNANTFPGNIQDGTGKLSLAITGSITQTLSGNNTYTGTTNIGAVSTLAAGSTTAFSSSSDYTVAGTLDIAGNNNAIKSLAGASTGIVTNSGAAATLTVNGSATTTFSGVIQDGAGQSGLTLSGSNNLTLTNANTFTGTATVNSGATLALTGSGNINAAGSTIVNGTFDISGVTTGVTAQNLSGIGSVVLGSKTLTANLGSWAGVISGTGNVTIGGNVSFTGTNTYNGTTTISSGTLTVGNGTTLGRLGSGPVVDNATLSINHSDSVTIAGNISGSGGVTQAGTGTTILTGTNNYATTTISAGTLQIGSGGTTGSLGSGAVTDNGTLSFNRSNSYTVANSITGTGSLVDAGTGTLVLTNTNGYTTTTINSGATIQLGASSTTGSLGSGNITDNGTLIIARSNAYNQVAIISGTGSVTQSGSGTLTFQTAQTYSGATNINTGTTVALQDLGAITNSSVADSGTFDITGITASGTTIASLSGAGTVVAGAKTLTISNGAGAFTGSLTGTAGLTISGGTETFNTAQTYTGTTTIASGAILNLGANGSVAGSIVDNGTLAYSSTGTVTLTSFSGITGSGGIAEVGGGTLIVNTQSPLTGTSSVTSGTLIVGDINNPTASLAGGVIVSSGATLEGHGTIKGNVTVNSGGTIKPGASIGTLTVTGAASIPAGTTFNEEFSNTAFSKLAASGAVTLGGQLTLVSTSATYTPGTDYKFITGSSVTGTFSSVTGAPAGVNTTVQYSATAVDLILGTPAAAPTVTNTFLFGTYGNTPNQIAAGNALTAASSTGTLYVALGNVVKTNTAAVPATLGQLAGDIHASIRSAAIEDSRVVRDTVLNRLDASAEGITVWSTLYGGYGSIATDGNAAGLHHDSSGAIIGADLKADDNLRLGAAVSYAATNASTSGKLSSAKGKLATILGYGGYSDGALDLKAGAAYSFGNLRLGRTIPTLGYGDSDSQSQRGAQIFATGGWKLATDQAMVEPYVGIAAISATSGAFVETGDAGALSGAAKTDSQTYATLGMKAALNGLALDNGMAITPKIDLGWQHSFGHLRPGQTVTFQNASQSFTVLGVPLGMDAAALQLGVDLAVAPDVVVNAGYDGSFSSKVQNNALRVGIDLAL